MNLIRGHYSYKEKNYKFSTTFQRKKWELIIFFPSLNKHLSTYYIPSSMLSVEDTIMSQNRHPCPHRPYSLVRDHINYICDKGCSGGYESKGKGTDLPDQVD